MNVAHLQQFLADLARLVASTDSKKAAADLERVVAGLEPFKTRSIAEFADFLPKAEEYQRTGVVGPSAPPPKGQAGTRSGTAIPAELRAELERLYASAGTDQVTVEMIDALGSKLDKLTKGQLVELSQVAGLVGQSSKTKPVIVKAILDRLRSIKQSAIRTSLIDRPGVQY